MSWPPLFSEGEAEIYHQGCAGEGDEQAERGVESTGSIDLLDLGVEILAFRFEDFQARPTGKGLQSRPHLRCQVVGPVKLGPAVAGSRKPDDVDALVPEHRPQVGQRRK